MSNDVPKLFPLRFPAQDTQFGITTLEKMGVKLGMDATATIHYALAKLAMQLLQAYEADDGPLSDVELQRIREAAGPQKLGAKILSSLIR